MRNALLSGFSIGMAVACLIVLAVDRPKDVPVSVVALLSVAAISALLAIAWRPTR